MVAPMGTANAGNRLIFDSCFSVSIVSIMSSDLAPELADGKFYTRFKSVGVR